MWKKRNRKSRFSTSPGRIFLPYYTLQHWLQNLDIMPRGVKYRVQYEMAYWHMHVKNVDQIYVQTFGYVWVYSQCDYQQLWWRCALSIWLTFSPAMFTSGAHGAKTSKLTVEYLKSSDNQPGINSIVCTRMSRQMEIYCYKRYTNRHSYRRRSQWFRP